MLYLNKCYKCLDKKDRFLDYIMPIYLYIVFNVFSIICINFEE